MSEHAKPRRFWYALLERVGVAFAGAFLSVVAAQLTDVGTLRGLFAWDVLDAALLAGLGGAVAAVLSMFGGLFGNKGTPSLLPARLDPATPPPVSPGTNKRGEDG